MQKNVPCAIKKANKEKLTKALNEELMQVTYIAMIPDAVDVHGDYTDAEQVRLAKESFNRAWVKNQRLANLFHLFETNSFDVIESYITLADMTLNGHFVVKGTWLMTLQINDESLWEAIKNEEIVGISIGAMANVESLDSED